MSPKSSLVAFFLTYPAITRVTKRMAGGRERTLKQAAEGKDNYPGRTGSFLLTHSESLLTNPPVNDRRGTLAGISSLKQHCGE